MKYLLLLATLALLSAPSLTAGGAVTTLNDSGAGSLRAAIASALAGDTLTFAAALNGQRILLTSGELVIDQNLTIDASALSNGITIDAAGNSRVFQITPGSTVTMNSLTLTGGNATGGFPANVGGAIYSDGASLSLTACTLFGNSASGSGGGIFSNGNSGSASLTLTACTLFGNSAVFGGGILSTGISGNASLSLTACTLSGNFAGFGGGIFSDGRSSGNASLSLTACTLSGNSAGFGGGILSTGISGSATLSLDNTILAANTAPLGSDLRENGTPAQSSTILLGVNLISDTSGNNGLAPAAALIVDPNPKLSPLGHYGGPVQTIHPLAGSPAIDPPTPAITPVMTSPLSTDARGFPRVVNDRVDIGAVETGPVTLVNNSGDAAGTATTLRTAISNATTPGAVIRFNPDVFDGELGDTIPNDLDFNIASDQAVFIDASNIPDGVIIDSGEENRIFTIASGATLALHSLTLTGGNATGDTVPTNSGGAIFINGRDGSASLSLTACTLFDNSANGGGGAIFNDGRSSSGSASLIITSCTLADNFAGSFGGAISSIGSVSGNASLSLTACTLSGNSAAVNGGGIFSDARFSGSVRLRLDNTVLAGNTLNNGAASDLQELGDAVELSTTLLGVNFIGDTSGINADALTGDTLTGDPMLDSLADNGGPTQTMLPRLGSPLIDAAGTSTLSTDQRGVLRPGGTDNDIGAVERTERLLIVNTLEDEDDGIFSGGISLREAIALPETEGITFAAALDGGSIILTHGQLVIDQNLTIDASALPEGITIDASVASPRHRILTIGTSPAADPLPTVHLINLLITGGQTSGSDGGGILNQGDLTLTDCTVSNNSTGDGGDDSESGGGDGGGGGGIFHTNSGTLTLNNCTVSNNSTGDGGDGDDDDGGDGGDGGGISQNSSGALILNNCTVSNNSTGGGGIGGISVAGSGGSGGGISQNSGTLTLNNCTVSNNSTGDADDGGLGGGSGGGISSLSNPLTLSNTVIAGNSTGRSPTGISGLGPDLRRSDTSFTSAGVNFIGVTSGITTALPGNILSGDPLLAPLGDYGGPTQTMLPLPGSPLIDAAGATDLTFDQRGVSRPIGAGGDIGAVEYAPSADLLSLWELDFDGDGSPFGVEQALGTDPFTPDPAAAGNLTSPTFNATGQATLTFGRNPDAEPHTIWRLTRTTDFLTFTEVYRFEGPDAIETLQLGINSAVETTSFTIIDETPPAGIAFYRFEAELVAP